MAGAPNAKSRYLQFLSDKGKISKGHNDAFHQPNHFSRTPKGVKRMSQGGHILEEDKDSEAGSYSPPGGYGPFPGPGGSTYHLDSSGHMSSMEPHGNEMSHGGLASNDLEDNGPGQHFADEDDGLDEYRPKHYYDHGGRIRRMSDGGGVGETSSQYDMTSDLPDPFQPQTSGTNYSSLQSDVMKSSANSKTPDIVGANRRFYSFSKGGVAQDADEYTGHPYSDKFGVDGLHPGEDPDDGIMDYNVDKDSHDGMDTSEVEGWGHLEHENAGVHYDHEEEAGARSKFPQSRYSELDEYQDGEDLHSEHLAHGGEVGRENRAYHGEIPLEMEKDYTPEPSLEEDEEVGDEGMQDNYSDGYSMEPVAHLAHGAKLGSGKRFAALEHKLSHQKGVTDPAALAASIGRKKFGAKKMAKMAAHNRAHGGFAKALRKQGY